MCEKVMLNNRNNKKMRLWHAVRKLTQGLETVVSKLDGAYEKAFLTGKWVVF